MGFLNKLKQKMSAGDGIQVRALQRGYYGDKRRLAGEIFSIDSEEHFSERWMEKVDASPEEMAAAQATTHPARVQSAPDARDIEAVIQKTLGDESVAKAGGVDRRDIGVQKPAARAGSDAGAEKKADSKGGAEQSKDQNTKPNDEVI